METMFYNATIPAHQQQRNNLLKKKITDEIMPIQIYQKELQVIDLTSDTEDIISQMNHIPSLLFSVEGEEI